MAKNPREAMARSALVISDPQASRQFGAHGSVLFWRAADDGGPRRGLLCVPTACDNPKCFAIHVWLGEVDSALSSASKKGRTFEFVLDANRADKRIPISEAFASYDTDSGTVAASEGHEKSPLVEWLRSSADGDVLTHMRTPLMQREFAAGRIMKPRAEK